VHQETGGNAICINQEMRGNAICINQEMGGNAICINVSYLNIKHCQMKKKDLIILEAVDPGWRVIL